MVAPNPQRDNDWPLAARKALGRALWDFLRAHGHAAPIGTERRNAVIIAGQKAHNDVEWYLGQALAAVEQETRAQGPPLSILPGKGGE